MFPQNKIVLNNFEKIAKTDFIGVVSGSSTGQAVVYQIPSIPPTGPTFWSVESDYWVLLTKFNNDLDSLRKEIASLREELRNRPLVSSIYFMISLMKSII